MTHDQLKFTKLLWLLGRWSPLPLPNKFLVYKAIIIPISNPNIEILERFQTEILRQDGISWHFVPPRSPHSGAIWESAVKSTKYRIKRVAGNGILAFEEWITLFTPIQQRSKWKGHSPNVQLDSLVIPKEDNITLSKWPLGRIVELHPGQDDIVRVVTVKTASGLFKRAVNNICILPENDC